MKCPLILGSQSPRRKEILSYYSIPFQQASPDFDEKSIEFQGDPEAYAITLAHGKGASLERHFPDSPILTADTVVFKDGKIFNKPADEDENLAMLKTLCGGWHTVYTAVAIRQNKQVFAVCEKTRVLMHTLDDEQLKIYLQTFRGQSKAGGYSIQKGGGVIVKSIEGCFYNVMGLPTQGLMQVLKSIGIDLWHYLAH